MSLFTFADIDALKDTSIANLAKYYKVNTDGLDRPKIINKILDALMLEQTGTPDGVQMSVRVRRIWENNRNG